MINRPIKLSDRLSPERGGGGSSPLLHAVAWLSILAMVALAILSVSPEAHELIHADADHADHACAVTLAQQGFCDTAATPPVATVAEFGLVVVPAGPTSHAWSAPGYWHVPGQAPPAGRS